MKIKQFEYKPLAHYSYAIVSNGEMAVIDPERDPKEYYALGEAQFGKPSGGPKNVEMLFSIEEIKDEFPQLDFNLLSEEHINLSQGIYHQGKADVIRFVGIKK